MLSALRRAFVVLGLVIGLTAPVAAPVQASPAIVVSEAPASASAIASVNAATRLSTRTVWAKKSYVQTYKKVGTAYKKARQVRIGYRFTVVPSQSNGTWYKINGRNEYVRVGDTTAKVSSLWSNKDYAKMQAWRRINANSNWNVDTQYPCVKTLWQHESGWRRHASNGRTWGIPQALPGSKMRSAGADWRNNPDTQVKWGLSYIKSRYKTPCRALQHFRNHNWY